MPRICLTFEELTLFEDEEAAYTHVVMYANVTDSGGADRGEG